MSLAAHPEMHGLANAAALGCAAKFFPLHPDEAPFAVILRRKQRKTAGVLAVI
jgi:hypothetical protein